MHEKKAEITGSVTCEGGKRRRRRLTAGSDLLETRNDSEVFRREEMGRSLELCEHEAEERVREGISG